jgi:hypothetical protein
MSFAGGDGTVENPYKIVNQEQLTEINNYLSSHFILIKDIEITGVWKPIGITFADVFLGSFDGQYHTITLPPTLEKNAPRQVVGLLSDNKGTIKNLIVAGNITTVVGITNPTEFGGIITNNDSTGLIINCISTVSMSAPLGMAFVNPIGGCVSRNSGTIRNCFATGNFSSTGNNTNNGGFVSFNTSTGKIYNCYATGNTFNGNIPRGFVNYNNGLVSNCYYAGSSTDFHATFESDITNFYSRSHPVYREGESDEWARPPWYWTSADLPNFIAPVFTLTINKIGYGVVSGNGTFDENTTQTITANTIGGWYFSRWEGIDADRVADVNSPSTTFDLSSNGNITAVFEYDFDNLEPIDADDLLFVEGDKSILEIETGILGDLNVPEDMLSDRATIIEIPEKTGEAVEVNYVYG